MNPVYPVALLSFGMSGRVFHAPFLQEHPGFRLLGAWERSKGQIQSYWPDAVSYSSLEDVLQSKAEVVVVNTPNDTHFDFTSRCLDAGKHVIVEKSFTVTASEARSLAAQAAATRKHIAVFQNRRWDSDFLAVRDALNSGKLGKVVEVQIGFDRFNPGLSAKVHKEQPTPGAGVLRDLGPHIIDQALFLFGMPEAVFGDLRVTREHSQIADYLEIILYYPDLRVRLHSGYFNREPVPAYVVHGTNGSFHHHRTDVQENQLQGGMSPASPEYGKDESLGLLHHMHGTTALREEIPTPSGNYMAFYDGFYQTLCENKPLPVTAEDGIRIMSIIDAVERSAREGYLIQVRPKT